jgi:hypothetical protein
MSKLDSLLSRAKKLEAAVLAARENSPEVKARAELADVQAEIEAERQAAYKAELDKLAGEREALLKDMSAARAKLLDFASEFIPEVDALNTRGGKVLGRYMQKGIPEGSIQSQRLYLKEASKYFASLLHHERAVKVLSGRQK